MMEQIRRREHSREISDPPPKEPAIELAPVATEEAQDGNSSFRNLLLFACAVPSVILLIFGGKVSLWVICFGGLLCYILDILGSVEGTLICVGITTMTLLGSLIWSARVFLSESFFNFALVILMGTLLFFDFAVMGSYFNVIMNEIGVLINILNVLVITTLPMLASAIITWFLCVEVPSFDVETCYCIVYFLYVLILCHPRYATKTILVKNSSNAPQTYVQNQATIIPLFAMKALYIIPIIMSAMIHVAVHHNVLSTNQTRLVNFLMSLLFPSLLMLICARRQIKYWPENERENKYIQFQRSIVIVLFILLICLNNHPIFNEIKSFSGVPEPWPTYMIVGIGFCGFNAFIINRYCHEYKKTTEEIEFHTGLNLRSNAANNVSMLESLISVCIGCASAILASLIMIPKFVIPIFITANVTISEFYHRRALTYFQRIALVVIAAISIFLTAIVFTQNTIFHMLFNFSWFIDISMQGFCKIFAVLLAGSLVIPTLLHKTPKSTDDSFDYLPVSSNSNKGDTERRQELGIEHFVFELLFMFAVIAFALVEIMVREQNWSALEVGVETIYPTYYLITSTCIILTAALGLYASSTITLNTMWTVLVVQGSKLLHLAGFPFLGIVSTGSVIVTFSAPFIQLIHEASLKADNFDITAIQSSTSKNIEIVGYVVGATYATYCTRKYMSRSILTMFLSHDASELQQTMACLSVWSVYVSVVLFVFYRKFKTLRSILVTISVVSLLLACDAFGRFNIEYDTTSSVYLSVSLKPDLMENTHSELYMLLSGALTLFAWVGIIPLRNVIVFVLYVLTFSFVATKGMISWAFPLSLADDSLTHKIFAFPFLYVYLSKICATIIAIWNTDGMYYNISYMVFLFLCFVPMIALFYCYMKGIVHESLGGIIWTTIIGNGSLCLSIYAREMTHVLNIIPIRDYNNKNQYVKINRNVISITSAMLTIFWTMIWVSFATAVVDIDVVVPLAMLILLCTKHGFIPEKHPVVSFGLSCSVWWVLSALYALFIKGWNEADGNIDFHASHDILGLDSNISIWTSDNAALSTLFQVLGLLVPLPAIVLAYLRRKGDTEEMLFILSIMSIVSVIIGQVSSIRYLGIAGIIWGGWRCYEIGKLKMNSDRLI